VARLLPSETRELLGESIRVVAISPVTAEAANIVGLPVDVIAENSTWPGIFEAIANEASTKLA
jgi:uroporphyrinogen-III synthase